MHVFTCGVRGCLPGGVRSRRGIYVAAFATDGEIYFIFRVMTNSIFSSVVTGLKGDNRRRIVEESVWDDWRASRG